MMVLTDHRPLPQTEDTPVSPYVREVIERHVEGLEGSPTAAIVEAICDELNSPTQCGQVLYYFLVESPLRPRDLLRVCQSIGLRRAHVLGTQAAHRRRERSNIDREPRWR